MANLEKEKHVKGTAKSSKIRSKEWRERKKKYISTLETKINQLTKEIETLKEENTDLKSKISNISGSPISKPQGKFENSLEEYEDFVYDKLPKMVKRNLNEVRFSTIECAVDHITDFRYEIIEHNYSDDRISLIKSLFKSKFLYWKI